MSGIIYTALTLFILIYSKKKFTFTDEPVSNGGKWFLLIFGGLLIVVNILYWSRAYYISSHPRDGYDAITQQVSHHVYKPQYLPHAIWQESQFHKFQEEYGLKRKVVRSIYSNLRLDIDDNTKIFTIIMTQAQVDPNFDLEEQLIKEVEESLSDNEYTLLPTTLSAPNIKQAFTFERGIVKKVDIITQDNIHISLISPRVSISELLKVAENLQ